MSIEIRAEQFLIEIPENAADMQRRQQGSLVDILSSLTPLGMTLTVPRSVLSSRLEQSGISCVFESWYPCHFVTMSPFHLVLPGPTAQKPHNSAELILRLEISFSFSPK